MRRTIASACVAMLALAMVGTAGAGSGADGSTFVLTSYDGTTLTALNDQNHSFVAQLGSTTTFKPAALEKYIPDRSVQGRLRAGGGELQRRAHRRDERRRDRAFERDLLACCPAVQGKGRIPAERPVHPRRSIRAAEPGQGVPAGCLKPVTPSLAIPQTEGGGR
jgi:hypothetical protein